MPQASHLSWGPWQPDASHQRLSGRCPTAPSSPSRPTPRGWPRPRDPPPAAVRTLWPRACGERPRSSPRSTSRAGGGCRTDRAPRPRLPHPPGRAGNRRSQSPWSGPSPGRSLRPHRRRRRRPRSARAAPWPRCSAAARRRRACWCPAPRASRRSAGRPPGGTRAARPLLPRPLRRSHSRSHASGRRASGAPPRPRWLRSARSSPGAAAWWSCVPAHR
mmetsp:Transcript_17476/g.54704  ORF Transcript_17476/g.54704 Transcript_17476/m.54704 type:complete len:218 (-) Transcript_17476:234-887(-)